MGGQLGLVDIASEEIHGQPWRALLRGREYHLWIVPGLFVRPWCYDPLKCRSCCEGACGMRNGGGGREVEAGVESGCVDNMISTLFVLNNNCTNYYENNGCLAAWPHAVLYLHSLGTSYIYSAWLIASHYSVQTMYIGRLLTLNPHITCLYSLYKIIEGHWCCLALVKHFSHMIFEVTIVVLRIL